jgi:uncharacterized protein
MLDRSAYKSAIRSTSLRHGKMAFVTGPRQVGKTTLARALGEGYRRVAYYNWDDPAFRRQWMKDPKGLVDTVVGDKSLLVLDELHKAPRWKTYLKGLYDLRAEFADIVVTGSARLDVSRRAGDSLVGRYFLYHLHPFTIGELTGKVSVPDEVTEALAHPPEPDEALMRDLLAFGGFPEPYLTKEPEFHRLWQRTRAERLVREDLRDLAGSYDVALIEALVALLPERIGSLFSLSSLVNDLSIAFATGKRWMRWLEALFFVYTIPPYAHRIARSLRKQPKLYSWDWSDVPSAGARFENLVAGHLRKACDAYNDTGKGAFGLYFVRDKEKREVDFLVTRDNKPWLLAECKTGELAPAESLRHFARVLRPEMVVQLVAAPGVHRAFECGDGKRGHVISADRFLALLP